MQRISDGFSHFDTCSLSALPSSFFIWSQQAIRLLRRNTSLSGWQTKYSLFKECRGNRLFILPSSLFLFFMLITSKSNPFQSASSQHLDWLNTMQTCWGANLTVAFLFPPMTRWLNGSKSLYKGSSEECSGENCHFVKHWERQCFWRG